MRGESAATVCEEWCAAVIVLMVVACIVITILVNI